ncbi:hypothetical protein [Pseudomonas aeruginosa]|uniref:hypothetical protein n=1 Tax=Pseudomonas aeruginosa TaxID=287 RepID=UPI001F2D43C0|nr:hypothetical protein [Pseudomonas aeruginosa]WMF72291.1 hypothetical protein HUK70_31895 [Pseudomonas aeruginosa]
MTNETKTDRQRRLARERQRAKRERAMPCVALRWAAAASTWTCTRERLMHSI